MSRIQRVLVLFLLVLGIYAGLTWFFFGSPHPCGILEARQTPYVLERVRATSSEQRKLALDLAKSMRADAVEAATRMFEDIRKRPQEALSDLHEHIWRLTPAQCTWRAIAWNPDPYKKK